MTIQRYSDPINVKRIWDSIRTSNHAHVSADLTKIVKYIQGFAECTSTQAESYVQQTLKDKLIM